MDKVAEDGINFNKGELEVTQEEKNLALFSVC